MTHLFDFEDYKKFLNAKLDDLDEGGRGSRARMSRSIGCQTAYTAQVLRGSSHFSLEQAEAINDFLGHTEDQGLYFLLLVQVAKAGSPRLRQRFQKQIQEIHQNRQLLKNRLQVKEHMAEHHQLIYYSHWIYGAVHALVSIPGFQTPERISERFGISIRQASETLQFLIEVGLLEQNGKNGIKIGKGQIHLGADSPLISKHHLNWRLQAMQAIEKEGQRGLHYSSVVSISKKDEKVIREKIVEVLREIKDVIRESKEEEVYSLNLDLFPV